MNLQAITNQDIETAFEKHQFQAYLQPQYNHATGMLVGAEALVRWIHPENGVVYPGSFIALFEENDIISRLDLTVFEDVCRFIRRCRDEKLHMVPISVNLSRYDIYKKDFLDEMEEIRKKYDVPVNDVRIEITESVASYGKDVAVAVIQKLHDFGYVVELDDFGSGYSSLNVLKDIDYDIIKLDMGFMGDDTTGKGGTILSSIVRMAKWLKIPVIAEGVETVEQADFLMSIGCDNIQGYLYSRPIPQNEYKELLVKNTLGVLTASLEIRSVVNPTSFWDSKSLETLIFNNYVGGAAIFSYKEGAIEILRVNKKYLIEMCMNMTEEDLIQTNPMDNMSDEGKREFTHMLKRAIETEEEQECETWRKIISSCCGIDNLCIRTTVIMIGKSEAEKIFYATIRNVTAEKVKYTESLAYEQKFKTVIEQANIYYWEYTVATKEMRPCYRCMRDLGLPPLVKNYPEPAIEQGIFPADYADMYRDWHRQLAAGVPHLEAVIPLTVGRVPFHVRYTTEFDEFGRPIKAYGSATFITDEEKMPD